MKQYRWLLSILVFGLFLFVASGVTAEKKAHQDIVKFVDAIQVIDGQIIRMDIAYVGDDEDKVLSDLRVVRASDYVLLGFSQSINLVPYHYNPNGSLASSAIIESGVEGWNSLGGPVANIVDPISPLRPGLCEGAGGDGKYTIAWGEVSGLAIGVACWSSTGEVDQKYDNTYLGTAALWKIVALHETGHGWGLGHSTIPQAIMYSSVSFQTELHQDDKDGFCAIYGCQTIPTLTPTSTFTPTNTRTATSTFTSTATPTRTNTPTVTPSSVPTPPGDADCDGDIDPVDALIILKIIAGILTPGCHNVVAIGVSRGIYWQ